MRRSSLPKDIFFEEKEGTNGFNFLDYKNSSNIKYIRDDVYNQKVKECEKYESILLGLKSLFLYEKEGVIVNTPNSKETILALKKSITQL